MISMIVAIDNENGIGKNNDLMWHLSDDLKRFKAITTGHAVIMGKNTWMSLPFKPLKNRRNIVISSSMNDGDGYETVRSVEDAVRLCSGNETYYVIGGGSIYKAMMEYADELIVTHVLKSFDADTFFPAIEESKWKVTEKSEIMHDDISDLDYQYVTYRRK